MLVEPPQILRIRHRKGFVEEIEYRAIEAFRILRGDQMRGAGEDGQLRLWDGVEDAQCVVVADDITVAGHDQGRSLYLVQVCERYVRLIPHEVEQLQLKL